VEEAVHSPRSIRFGTFEVDLQAGELRKSGLKLKLTGQPFDVLVILLERTRRKTRALSKRCPAVAIASLLLWLSEAKLIPMASPGCRDTGG